MLQSPPRKNLPGGQAQVVAAQAGGSSGRGHANAFEPPDRRHTARPSFTMRGKGPDMLFPERSSKTDADSPS